MCVYISLPLEGELDLLVDSRTWEGSWSCKMGEILEGLRRSRPAGSRVFCLPLSPGGSQFGSLCPCIIPPWS